MFAYRKEVQERERSSKKLQMEVSSLKEEVKILEDQIATQEDVVKKAKPDEAKLEEMNANGSAAASQGTRKAWTRLERLSTRRWTY